MFSKRLERWRTVNYISDVLICSIDGKWSSLNEELHFFTSVCLQLMCALYSFSLTTLWYILSIANVYSIQLYGAVYLQKMCVLYNCSFATLWCGLSIENVRFIQLQLCNFMVRPFINVYIFAELYLDINKNNEYACLGLM